MSAGGFGKSSTPGSKGAARASIIAAAIEIITDQGPGSLTFRNVAKAANLSLGTVTYHFSDKNDLLRVAIEQARDETLRRDLATLAEYLKDHDRLDALAHYVGELTQQSDGSLLTGYRVYATALYFSDLRELVSPWHLESMLDSLGYGKSARAAAILAEGILLYSVVRGVPVSVEEVRDMLAPHFAHA